MPEPETSSESSFHSNYDFGVDPKRRVLVPSKWRAAVDEKELTLLVWTHNPGGQACIRVLPPEMWNRTMDRIKALPTLDPKAVSLRRYFASNSDKITMKSGRLCIPDWMAREVGIQDKALLAGALEWFEIWNPESHAVEKSADDSLSLETLASI